MSFYSFDHKQNKTMIPENREANRIRPVINHRLIDKSSSMRYRDEALIQSLALPKS